MDAEITKQLQNWLNTTSDKRDYAEGNLLLLKLSKNGIRYHNFLLHPERKADVIEYELNKYLKFRLAKVTREQVNEMQKQVDSMPQLSDKAKDLEDFAAGKRSDHEYLPPEIQKLWVENGDIRNRMREVHLRLRTLSLNNVTCPDSERYPFLKELIELDKKYHSNWYEYDHFIMPRKTTAKKIRQKRKE